MSQGTSKFVYYSYFHSLISYREIFWGNSSNSLHFFQPQSRAIRIINGSRPRDSCTKLFKKWRILPLQSQYTLSLLLFVMNNENLFHCNSEIHSFNTRQSCNLHQCQANLSLYKKGVYYSGIKVFDSRPHNIKKHIFLYCECYGNDICIICVSF
jgi:hypothetical protein